MLELLIWLVLELLVWLVDELQATKADEATSPTASRTTTLKTRMNPPSAMHRSSAMTQGLFHAINGCATGAGASFNFTDTD